MLHAGVGVLSQPERLVGAMAAKSITHGQTVRVDLEHVEVSAKAGGPPVIYFCGIHELSVRETLAPGDGGGLPPEVVVRGLGVGKEGFYDIQNALITSNGKIDIIIDRQSRVVPERGFFSRFALTF
jgi:hypothetical protein